MRIDLRVSYAEKDKARLAGARWDRARRCWYVIDPEDVRPFLRWLPSHLTRPHRPMKEAA